MVKMTYQIACAVIAFATVGCSNPNAFMVNNQAQHLSDNELRDLRTRWRPDALELAANSQVAPNDLQWILDLIAYQEGSGATGNTCQALSLEKITSLNHKYIKYQSGHTFGPLQFIEEWQVTACGLGHTWHVMNDGINRYKLQVVFVRIDQPAAEGYSGS